MGRHWVWVGATLGVATWLSFGCSSKDQGDDDDDDGGAGSMNAPPGCATDTDCRGGLVCGLDDTCRSPCAVPTDCTESDMQCVLETCVSPAETSDGGRALLSCATGTARCVTSTVREVCNSSAPGWVAEGCSSAAPYCVGGECKVGVTPAAPGPLVMLASTAGSYGIDRTEVTRSAYARFLIEKGTDTSGQTAVCSWNKSYDPIDSPAAPWPPLDQGDHPVSHVDWCDAYAYCQWAGKRLCGKIGGGSIAGNNNIDDSTDQWVNACSADSKNSFLTGYDYFPDKCQDLNSGATATAPVASNPECQSIDAAFQGVFDQQGNVAEWIDRCTGSEGAGDTCSTPGGDFESTRPELACGTTYALLRGDARSPNINVGFRCCSAP